MADHIQIGDRRPWVQIEQTVDGNKDFTFDFPIFQEADLEVYLDGVLQTPAAHYTVTGVGNSDGGTVEFTAAPVIGAAITLRRRLAIQRTTDFQESGEFRARVINDELDYQTAAIQQIADDVKRTLTLSPTDPDASLALPDKAARAGKFLWFDAEGNLVIAAGLADATVSAAMESVVAATTKEAALDLLDPDILKADTADNLQVGFTQDQKKVNGTDANAETGTSALTPLFADSNGQHATVTGDFTLNAPTTGEGTMVIEFTNDTAGPHSPTFTGFDSEPLPGSQAWNAANGAINWVAVRRRGTTSHYGIFNNA